MLTIREYVEIIYLDQVELLKERIIVPIENCKYPPVLEEKPFFGRFARIMVDRERKNYQPTELDRHEEIETLKEMIIDKVKQDERFSRCIIR